MIDSREFEIAAERYRISAEIERREKDNESFTYNEAKMYTFREYSKDAYSTVMYPDAGQGTLNALNYTVLAAVGEAGELANKLKKVWRGDKTLDKELKAAMADEVGDVLWYLDRVMVELGYSDGLESAAKMNIAKLKDRRARNKTKGDGDTR